jgi:hypothetical protein
MCCGWSPVIDHLFQFGFSHSVRYVHSINERTRLDHVAYRQMDVSRRGDSGWNGRDSKKHWSSRAAIFNITKKKLLYQH